MKHDTFKNLLPHVELPPPEAVHESLHSITGNGSQLSDDTSLYQQLLVYTQRFSHEQVYSLRDRPNRHVKAAQLVHSWLQSLLVLVEAFAPNQQQNITYMDALLEGRLTFDLGQPLVNTPSFLERKWNKLLRKPETDPQHYHDWLEAAGSAVQRLLIVLSFVFRVPQYQQSWHDKALKLGDKIITALQGLASKPD